MFAGVTGALTGTLATPLGGDDRPKKILLFGLGFFLGSAFIAPTASKLSKIVAPISLKGGFMLGAVGAVASIIFFKVWKNRYDLGSTHYVMRSEEELLQHLEKTTEVSDSNLSKAIEFDYSEKTILSLMKKNLLYSDLFPEESPEPVATGWTDLDISDEDVLILDCFREVIKWLPMSEIFRLRSVSKAWFKGAEQAIKQLQNGLNKTFYIKVPTNTPERPLWRYELFCSPWKNQSKRLEIAKPIQIQEEEQSSQSTKVQLWEYRDLNAIFEKIKYQNISAFSMKCGDSIEFSKPIFTASLLLYHALKNPMVSSFEAGHSLILEFHIDQSSEDKTVTLEEVSYLHNTYPWWGHAGYYPIGIFSNSNDKFPVCIINIKGLDFPEED